MATQEGGQRVERVAQPVFRAHLDSEARSSQHGLRCSMRAMEYTMQNGENRVRVPSIGNRQPEVRHSYNSARKSSTFLHCSFTVVSYIVLIVCTKASCLQGMSYVRLFVYASVQCCVLDILCERQTG